MRTSIRAAVAAMVLLLLASGCSDGDPSPRDPSSTWSPTGKMETPTSAAPDPVEPDLPAAAKEATEAGARAFIEYYWELINYAQVTGDVKALKGVSGPNCEGCNAGIDGIRNLYRGGGHATGGAYDTTVKSLAKVPFDAPAALAYKARVLVRNKEQAVVNADGSLETLAPATNAIVVYLLWVDERWRTDVLVVKS
ncbi:DUF6318 family protein [Pimelobacter simplex]|uniref:DUF6318 family protein n=1 Tax=Nocardioides simplex TaxID=2045 RepID=UPI001933E999|nr:hypothetical protein [Pimelobacter simplex]